MGSALYVWPLYMLGGLSADLQSGNGDSDGLKIASNQFEEHGVVYTQFSISFDVDSRFSSTGRISLLVSGQRSPSDGQAARSTVLAMFEAVRVNYDIFSADYSYVVLSEKRQLYNAMKESLDSFCSIYDRIEEIVKETQSAMNSMNLSLSDWLDSAHLDPVLSDEIAVSGFQCWISETLASTDTEIEHSVFIMKLLLGRDIVPDDQCRLDVTAPMPMHIDWEASYFDLRTVFLEAVSKMNCNVSPIHIVGTDDGPFKADIQVSVEPFLFVGALANTPVAAKVKLMYAILKHVNLVLGYPIMDLHHSVSNYQDKFIRYFDYKIHRIWRSGQWLNRVMMCIDRQFMANRAALLHKLSSIGCALHVRTFINVFSGKLDALKEQLPALWSSFVNAKVDRAMLEAAVVHGA